MQGEGWQADYDVRAIAVEDGRYSDDVETAVIMVTDRYIVVVVRCLCLLINQSNEPAFSLSSADRTA